MQETEVLLKFRGSCSPGLEQVRAQHDGLEQQDLFLMTTLTVGPAVGGWRFAEHL